MMSSDSKQVPGRSEVELLRQQVRRLELEKGLLERSLLVADHERRKAEELVKYLQQTQGRLGAVSQEIGRGEVDKALQDTRKMISSIYAGIPAQQPETPEGEVQ